MRLAGLLGLTASDIDNDRVRALVARAALDREDGPAACEILSAAIMRRSTTACRPSLAAAAVVAASASAIASAFAPELCEAIDLVVDRRIRGTWMTGVGGGSGSSDGGERGFDFFKCVFAWRVGGEVFLLPILKLNFHGFAYFYILVFVQFFGQVGRS